MTQEDDAIAAANRTKEKELRKREELYRAKVAALAEAKAAVDSLSQELDAREVVLCEAEAKHGALLKREEEAEVRERDLADRERQIGERASALAAKETALEAEGAALQKEHERRMFPLAALEQEVYRREAELRALELDHEAKLRAFQKRVHQEEERERLKDKQVRELEAKAKDAAAKAERREKEAEQQQQLLTERSKALKAGQVELESRDRDLKWRDEQLRLAQTEVHLTKGRLMQWERELDLRSEGLEAKSAELTAREQELATKELAVQDRMGRLLAAEREVEAKQKRTAKGLDEATAIREDATHRAEEAEKHKARAAADEKRVAELRAELETLKASAAKKEENAAKRKARLEEKERAVKDWVAELEFREQQLSRREAQYGKDLNAATGGSVSLAQLQQQRSGAGGDGGGHGNQNTSAQLTGGIAKMQLARMQESYLAGSAQPPKRDQKGAKGQGSGVKSKPAMNIASANPNSDPFAPTAGDDFMARAEREAVASELDRHVAGVARNFAQCCVKFYSMSDDGIRHVFSTGERDAFKQCFEAEEQWKEDVRFLDTVFFTASSSSSQQPAPLAFSSTVQWNAWFATARSEALQRKRQLQSLRLSRLTSVVEMFTRKEESESLAQYFPLNHYRILREREAAARAGRSVSPHSGDDDDRRPGATSDASDEEAESRGKKKDRRASAAAPGPKKTKHVTAAQQDIQRVLDNLPPYLRKHYEEEGGLGDASKPAPAAE
eukprot:CAMPEP_0174833810 /NCGR_PEP_ID=MMETSP1114-20130205/4456_1 /TAXON_ID=312471 /ORGANISM="Neobodo designis, Strain CCAP 1951/1" /LENGTH=731 /DNA_ID=CAMNT_0016067705 /DNA_START=88 /DNA_END=2283 /DNA_ORIENTATION=-